MAKRYHSDMINNDYSKMANLPQEVMIKKYPESTGYLSENLNDGMSGIDKQTGKDNAKKRGNLQPDKY